MINRKARGCVFIYTKGEVRSAQADGQSSVWILRTISTKKIVPNRNNNDGSCRCLWIRLYRPRGVCATWFDCVYVYRVKEASAGSAPVSVLRCSLRVRPKGI
jgi:hypothetical protein